MAGFTDLPREIRDEIYSIYLSHVRAVTSCYERFEALDLLSVNRQVGSEAAQVRLRCQHRATARAS